MKLGQLGFPSGNNSNKTDGMGIYRPEVNSLIKSGEKYSNSYTLHGTWNQSSESNPTAVALSSDGSKVYVIGTTNKTVYQFTLSEPWDITTASSSPSASRELNSYLNGQIGIGMVYPSCLEFKPDGTKMFVSDYERRVIIQLELSTAWNVSTAYVDTSHGGGTGYPIHWNRQDGDSSGGNGFRGLRAFAFSEDGDNLWVASNRFSQDRSVLTRFDIKLIGTGPSTREKFDLGYSEYNYETRDYGNPPPESLPEDNFSVPTRTNQNYESTTNDDNVNLNMNSYWGTPTDLSYWYTSDGGGSTTFPQVIMGGGMSKGRGNWFPSLITAKMPANDSSWSNYYGDDYTPAGWDMNFLMTFELRNLNTLAEVSQRLKADSDFVTTQSGTYLPLDGEAPTVKGPTGSTFLGFNEFNKHPEHIQYIGPKTGIGDPEGVYIDRQRSVGSRKMYVACSGGSVTVAQYNLVEK